MHRESALSHTSAVGVRPRPAAGSGSATAHASPNSSALFVDHGVRPVQSVRPTLLRPARENRPTADGPAPAPAGHRFPSRSKPVRPRTPRALRPGPSRCGQRPAAAARPSRAAVFSSALVRHSTMLTSRRSSNAKSALWPSTSRRTAESSRRADDRRDGRPRLVVAEDPQRRQRLLDTGDLLVLADLVQCLAHSRASASTSCADSPSVTSPVADISPAPFPQRPIPASPTRRVGPRRRQPLNIRPVGAGTGPAANAAGAGLAEAFGSAGRRNHQTKGPPLHRRFAGVQWAAAQWSGRHLSRPPPPPRPGRTGSGRAPHSGRRRPAVQCACRVRRPAPPPAPG